MGEREKPLPESSNLRDPTTFALLVSEHRAGVERLVRRLAGFPEEVDDMVQEVFARAWEKASRYRGDAAPDVWLRGIAVRVAREEQRSPWRVRRSSTALAERAATEPVSPQSALHAALTRLPQALREVLVLRYLEELSPLEIARLLRLGRGAVDMRLTRARAALREALGDESDV